MTKPLTVEEVPTEHQDSFEFSNQTLEPVGSRTGLKIVRKCSVCPGTYKVLVTNIRGDLKRGRKMRGGKCGGCKGRVISTDGYVWLYKTEHPNAYNGKYVPEHIWNMEQKLGRFLDTSVESVHHIDGDRANNKIENLQLRTRYHGAGQSRVCGDCGSHNIKAVEI